MPKPCVCRHDTPARAGSWYCGECYRLSCEPGACHRSQPVETTRECPACNEYILVPGTKRACDRCDGTGRIPIESVPPVRPAYYSRERLDQDYEDEMRRRDEKGRR